MLKAKTAKPTKKKPIQTKSKTTAKVKKSAKKKTKSAKTVLSAKKSKSTLSAEKARPQKNIKVNPTVHAKESYQEQESTIIPQDALVQTNMPHGGIPFKSENFESQRAENLEAKYAKGLKKPRGTSTHTFKSPGHGRGSSNKSDL